MHQNEGDQLVTPIAAVLDEASFFFLRQSRLSWSAMAQSRLTATFASWDQAILLPQPPE